MSVELASAPQRGEPFEWPKDHFDRQQATATHWLSLYDELTIIADAQVTPEISEQQVNNIANGEPLPSIPYSRAELAALFQNKQYIQGEIGKINELSDKEFAIGCSTRRVDVYDPILCTQLANRLENLSSVKDSQEEPSEEYNILAEELERRYETIIAEAEKVDKNILEVEGITLAKQLAGDIQLHEHLWNMKKRQLLTDLVQKSPIPIKRSRDFIFLKVTDKDILQLTSFEYKKGIRERTASALRLIKEIEKKTSLTEEA